MTRTLDYCGVRSICGKAAADCLFGRHLPDGVDMDQPGDEETITAIVREASRCEDCPERAGCEPVGICDPCEASTPPPT